mmetsp:Transcript_12687/g.18088  ORF Transcript_12687/g.18088 Transcript_12687/m.18088 type:complete len:116 (+) Transcript_12687:70-417(+)
MSDLFETERPNFICHMAALAGVCLSIQDPYAYIHSNIKGTTRLLELAHQFGVTNFTFASTSCVYGGSTSTYSPRMKVLITLCPHMSHQRRHVSCLLIHNTTFTTLMSQDLGSSMC